MFATPPPPPPTPQEKPKDKQPLYLRGHVNLLVGHAYCFVLVAVYY